MAALLDKLRVEFTKSRPRHSNDNGLVETKNGAVVRKIFGYEHIAQRNAGPINVFCAEQLTPFLNLHRPCLFATLWPDPKKPGWTASIRMAGKTTIILAGWLGMNVAG